jgi:hypothetical protein
MRHISEIAGEYLAEWQRRLWVLRLVKKSGLIELSRGRAFDDLPGRQILVTALHEDDARHMQRLLILLPFARACKHCRTRWESEAAQFFAAVHGRLCAEIRQEINERGNLDHLLTELDAVNHHWSAEKDAEWLARAFDAAEKGQRNP